ncbi:hypothetical protein ACLOJK_012481 [Asimina triloba]
MTIGEEELGLADCGLGRKEMAAAKTMLADLDDTDRLEFGKKGDDGYEDDSKMTSTDWGLGRKEMAAAKMTLAD